MRSTGILCVVLGAGVWGCAADSGNPKETEPTGTVTAPLKHLASCTDLETLIRERTRAEMNANLDALDKAVDTSTGNCYENDMGGMPSRGGVLVAAADSTNGSPTSVSETNNQVAGVDEADLVKTDGQYLYLAQGNELRIVSAWPADQTHIASRLALAGTAKKLFVAGDRALVYVSIPRSTQTEDARWYTGAVSDCTYGYDCDFTGDGTATDLVLLDIADRAAPKVLRRLNLTGSLIAARRIGNTVHSVVSIGQVKVPDLVNPAVSIYSCGNLTEEQKAQAHTAIAEARAKNNAIIDAASFNTDALVRDGDRSLGDPNCGEFYQETAGDGTAITTVISQDLQATDDPTITNIVSRGGAVYATAESLYMSVSHQRSDMSYWYWDTGAAEASTVHKFRIGQSPSQTAYLGSGVVPGRVLNQFSMDEYQGDLRVATTTGHVPNPDVESTLTVLRMTDNALKTVGQITGIAKTEDIRSVRFDGPRGYLVSFKKTDPLFVLDLSNAAAPAIVGELKIPGFSTYMHLLDAGHLLALGYEGDDHGSFAYFNGIQLQIFDVTNPTQPALVHKKVYGTRGSSSSALTDHLGFTFLSDRGLLTLPMSICDGGGDGNYGSLSFSGVVALKVSVADGFAELGRLEEPYPATSSSTFYYGAACQDWWTDSNSVVSRTVVLDNYVYAVSDNRVRVQNLTQLGTDVKLVDFTSTH